MIISGRRSSLTSRPRALTIVAAAVLVLGLSTWAEGAVLGSLIQLHWRTVTVFTLAVFAAEVARLRMPSGRLTAPLSSAAALGLAFLGPVQGEPTADFDGGFVVIVVATGMVLAAALHRLRGVRVRLGQVSSRLLAVSLAVLMAREWRPGGSNVGELLADPVGAPSVAALGMVLVSGIALAIEMVLSSVVRAERLHTSWRTSLLDELGEVAPLTFAVVASGPLVALMAPSFGLMSLPAALFPLAITYVAVGRYARNRLTYRQTIATLAHLTEHGGYTPAGHAERVSRTSVRIGRILGLSERELRDLEYAALLHDLGQISLAEPIPRGATVLAAPVDQRDIAGEGARIVRQAEGLDVVAGYIESQATPYRQVREQGDDVPLVSRIIKVANAFDDLTGGSQQAQSIAAAMERIHLGLGYEYDPEVVDALTRATVVGGAGWSERAPAAAR
ncbi:MAG: HD domain-containing phosphohydrolase [Ornithinibacter sp.]